MEKSYLTWEEFKKVDLRVGTVTKVETFPEARNPAYKVWVDFGGDLGIRKTSAQITVLYSPEELVGKQVIGVTNFEPKQIGPFMSEFLLTGFADENNNIIIATANSTAPNGAKLI
ncbi:tRNA-binding protein [Membranihabitans marinus]|uniref:tRNA-binding protein n=1 Tax=Membranihabitans marinus TaxID=1227546 RepID=UPI001F01200B|nr:tRNA-binding protein [Membranihabitans marinus]